MKVHVEYTDGTIEEFDNLQDAQQGIQETVTGCDFATSVRRVYSIPGDDPEDEREIPLFCNWSCTLTAEPLRETTLAIKVRYNPAATDPESLAAAFDQLLDTALSTPDILADYDNPSVDEFYVLDLSALEMRTEEEPK